MRKFITLLLFFPCLVIAQKAPRQLNIITSPCTDPGTVPSKAIPVCGTTVFTQNAVTNCTGPNIAQTGCPSDPFPSTASFWYKFTCFSSGTLSFAITPNLPTDDYDWVLFDATGHNPNDVFTDPTMMISINGSWPAGVVTGCDASGTTNVNCYNSAITINKMENIIMGHNYLLMVTNYTNSGAGYNLSFGGSAVISDGAIPAIDHIVPGCNSITVYFTTDMKCTSITPSGSEFSITPGINTITGVSSDCSLGFIVANAITINFLNPLPAGTYTLTINRGTDANTFTNICDNELPPGSNANFTVLKPIGNFILPPETCLGLPTQFTSSSDPLAGNTVAQWHWDFGDATTSTLQNPSHTYLTAGSFIVKHWIVNSLGCYSDTSVQTVVINPLPTANYTYTAPRCETRDISFTDISVANVGVLTDWFWDFGDATTSTVQNPVHVYTAAGTYTVSLTVTDSKGCKKTVTKLIVINARPLAGFIIPEVCLNDTYAQFLDTSKIASGTITNWQWNFGDPGSGILNFSNLQNPQHSYTATGSYDVQLIVTSNNGCKDTIVQTIYVNGSFPVADFSVNNLAALCSNDSVSIVNASTVFPGSISKIEIHWDDAGSPLFDTDNSPVIGKIYKHLYANFQSPLTKTYTIRLKAYSGVVCVNDKLKNITINASPKVQFDNIPDTCLLAAPFQITQASEVGGVPGSGVYSGPGITPSGIFNPGIAGVGTHTIKYRFTSAAGGCADSLSKTITVLDTATAKFSYVLPVCQGFPTSFTDQSTAPAGVTLNNTIWNFGDGSPVENHAPGSTFNHLFPGVGTYNVSVFNTSAYGCSSTVHTEAVTVDPNHTVTLTSAASTTNQTLCINTLITPITYMIGGGATGVVITGLPPGVTYAQVGNIITISGAPNTTAGSPFNYSLTTTGNNCSLAFASGTIIVQPDHTITLSSLPATPVQRVCINTAIDPIQYTIGGGATGVLVSNLPPGVSYTLVGNTVTITGSPNTTAGSPYNFSILTTGNSCIKASVSGKITVSPNPVPLVSLDKPSYCIPNAVVTFNNGSTIEDGTENAFIYLWNFGEPSSGVLNTSVAKSPSHHYSSTGPFIVNLAITSMYGCVHDTTFQLTTVHPQPHAQFSMSKPSLCLGDEVAFTDNTNPLDGTTTEWHWNIGDGSIRGIPSFTYTYSDTLEYSVSLYIINSNGCPSDTLTKQIKVYPNPTVYAGADRMVLQGGRVLLKPVTDGVELQYLWTPVTYLQDNTIKNAIASVIMEDITYTLTVTARGGCRRSDDIFIKVLKPPVIPNTFTPNNDGINDKWVITYLKDYPECRVEVFSRTGQKLFESAKGYPSPWDGTYMGKPLPFDTYYYIIEPGSGRDPITGYITLVK